jgi:sodium-dependent dicarboxylate transporter 2/3/5
MTASESAAAYYSPILFLVLGGAIVALAIERTGLHRRLALAIVSRGGGGPAQMLFAFMAATALLSMIVSNTATTLIMIPIGIAVLRAAKVEPGHTQGFAGALAMGIAFAATIGGFGTLVGSPTNAIAVGIIDKATGYRIDFLTWALYGIPLVLVCVPLCWAILMKVQRVSASDFDPAAARAGIGEACPGRRPRKGSCRSSLWSWPPGSRCPSWSPMSPRTRSPTAPSRSSAHCSCSSSRTAPAGRSSTGKRRTGRPGA